MSDKKTFPTLTAAQGSKQWLGNQEAFSGDYFISQSVSENQRAEVILSDKTGTLKTGGGKPGQGYPCVIRYSKSHREKHVDVRFENDGTTNTINTGQGGSNQSTQNIVCFRTNGIGEAYNQGDKTSCITTSTDLNSNVITDKIYVRRLTPLECERLQGFPDNWTEIKGSSEAKRYKACGNSMAVPVLKWLGMRITEVNNKIRVEK